MASSRQRSTLPWFIALTAAVLVFGYINGVTAPNRYTNFVQPALNQLKHLAQSANSPLASWALIFGHNIMAAVTFLVTGLFLGIIPVITLWYNGVLMGYVTVLGADKLHVPEWKLFACAMLPHGLLELPALIWAGALGVQLGFTLLYTFGRYVRGMLTGTAASTRGESSIRAELKRVARHGIWIFALLFLAAGIESMVTPKLIQWGLMSSPG